MCYERYHWTYEDVMELPVMHAEYIPIVWAAVAEIHNAEMRRNR
jgi:hypothetical protein